MGKCWWKVAPLGDSALRIDCGDLTDSNTANRVAQATAALSQVSEGAGRAIRDVVPAWTTIAVHYDAARLLAGRPRQSAATQVGSWVDQRLKTISTPVTTGQREIVVPVAYGGTRGPDLEDVARHAGLSCDEVVRLHAGAGYRVRAIGFTPGFPYLEGLPSPLATPRRASPRTRVPGGSVGIGGSQTGVYPVPSPGGWNLIGQTATRLFNPLGPPPCGLEVGDLVRFVVADEQQVQSLVQECPPDQERLSPAGPPIVEVIEPGLQTVVQAEPRWGQQRWGVTPGGSMASMAACVANMVLGNEPGAPVMEAAIRGPKLRWRRRVTVAVTGAVPEGVPTGRPLTLARGEILDLSRLAEARCYVAVAGGFAADEALGGRGTHLQLGVGGHEGRALRKGDALHLAAKTQIPKGSSTTQRWFVDASRLGDTPPEGVLRIVRGPQADWFSQAVWKRLLASEYRVTPRSDRMGIRLEGEALNRKSKGDMLSEGVVTGALQVPPDGQPIILGVDRQTIGGYPVIACVVSVDWDRLAQLRAGMPIRFREISHAEAEELLATRGRHLALLKEGLACHA